jgi:hypothetical protein
LARSRPERASSNEPTTSADSYLDHQLNIVWREVKN